MRLQHVTQLAAAGALVLLAACSSTESSGDAAAEAEANDRDLSATGVAEASTTDDLAAVSEGRLAPEFTLTDTNGTAHSLADFSGKTVVLEWINHGCPYVKKHYTSENMQALQAEYTEQDVVWLSICSSKEGAQGHMSNADWNAKTAELGAVPTAVLVDENGAVGRLYEAKKTPTMFVINASGQIVYEGAIDDQSIPSPASVAKANNYLRPVLDALIQGEPVEPQVTNAYGCGVKY